MNMSMITCNILTIQLTSIEHPTSILYSVYLIKNTAYDKHKHKLSQELVLGFDFFAVYLSMAMEFKK